MESKKSFFKGAFCGALAMLIISAGMWFFLGQNETSESVIDSVTEQKMKLLQDMIDETYLFEDEVDIELVRESLIKGYVDGFGDPYTVYYNEEETKSLLESTSGEFGGIGVGISQNIETGIITFTQVYENSPGEKAGFKNGDIVYKVDGEDITGLDLEQVVSKIRGEKGTKVEITVLRGDTREEYTSTVTRDIIEVETVLAEMKTVKTAQGKDKKVGYIIVSGFELVTTHQFEEALMKLTADGMEGLIVDLRNNPGGNLSTVCEMLDLILPEGMLVYTEDKNGNKQTMTSDEEHHLEIPMAVLINGNSASASEIFAGAIQDYEAGTLVGTTTFGKGIVQNLYQMTDGTCLKVTTSEYFTPNGRNIHGIGIKPDVEIEYEYDEANPEKDNQLEEALKCFE